MSQTTPDPHERLRERYARIVAQLEPLYAKVRDPQARMASAAALLHHKMPHFFWTGFYRLEDGDLIVGPYQGPIACMVLERHTGVCWASVDRGEPVLVADVHAFPGHIACDAASRSELVVPILRDGKVLGVIDLDSPDLARFDADDAQGIEALAGLLSTRI
jgi:L-methionine (R)-S-oxide reductase